jgi:hypothetical protein
VFVLVNAETVQPSARFLRNSLDVFIKEEEDHNKTREVYATYTVLALIYSECFFQILRRREGSPYFRVLKNKDEDNRKEL